MLVRTEKLRALDRDWEMRRYESLSYRDALALYTALWVEARTLRDDPGGDWTMDLDADLAVARALNGLPPA